MIEVIELIFTKTEINGFREIFDIEMEIFHNSLENNPFADNEAENSMKEQIKHLFYNKKIAYTDKLGNFLANSLFNSFFNN